MRSIIAGGVVGWYPAQKPDGMGLSLAWRKIFDRNNNSSSNLFKLNWNRRIASSLRPRLLLYVYPANVSAQLPSSEPEKKNKGI